MELKVGDWVTTGLTDSDNLYHIGIIDEIYEESAYVRMKVCVWLGNYQNPRSYSHGLHGLEYLGPYTPTIEEVFKIRKVQDEIKRR